MKAPLFDLVILDWDGTIADSTGMIVDAVMAAAVELNIPPPSRALTLSSIGLGINALFLKLFPHIAEDILEKMKVIYRSYYHANEAKVYLFEGVKEGIERLYQHKCKLAVATGKSRNGLNFTLQHTELKRYFLITKTVDECFSKPHPHMIEAILEETMMPRTRAVMVGDTHYDLEMGKNAHIQTIAVTYGAQPKEVLKSYEPLACCDSFKAVVDFLLP